jgi:uncharacterized protein
VTRVPSDDPDSTEPLAVAGRLAVTLRRHLLAVAQAGLRTVREALAQIPVPRTDRAPVAPTPTAPPALAAVSPGVKGAHHPHPPLADLLRSETPLPETYGSERVVLLVRDPHCLFAYWDLSEKRRQTVRAEAGSGPLRLVLRTYDVTTIRFDARPPERFQDFAIAGEARSVYAYVGKPAACFVAEVGYLRPDGAFFSLARSQPVWTPRTEQSGEVPGRWMTVGWTERASPGTAVPSPTVQIDESPAVATNGTTAAHGVTPIVDASSSWPGPAPIGAQRGSWSLVRGGLAAPGAPIVRGDQ